jgi:hypothetical protein
MLFFQSRSLATAVSVAPQSMLCANIPQYDFDHVTISITLEVVVCLALSSLTSEHHEIPRLERTETRTRTRTNTELENVFKLSYFISRLMKEISTKTASIVV